jgi:cold shock CspA family protein
MWNADRGFGLIGDDSGGPDIFLQYQRPSISRLRSRRHQEGRAVAFDVENTCDGKTKTSNRRRPAESEEP